MSPFLASTILLQLPAMPLWVGMDDVVVLDVVDAGVETPTYWMLKIHDTTLLQKVGLTYAVVVICLEESGAIGAVRAEDRVPLV